MLDTLAQADSAVAAGRQHWEEGWLRTEPSPLPDEPDVHLCVSLSGVRFHFAACLTAAMVFIQENRHRRHFDEVSVLPGGAGGLRRMANERLFIEP